MVEAAREWDIQAARKREVRPGNSGLPEGAVRYVEPVGNYLLREIWAKEIEFYRDTCQTLWGRVALEGYKVEESGVECEIFHCQLHPRVEGYAWYRGFAIAVEGGKVLLFTGWMQPWVEGGAPDPIVYLLGNPRKEVVLEVIRAHCSRIQARIGNSIKM